uniref:RxLR effector protein n=1 Tax=Globodera pallida TaxID=36090 RepID=A0A183CBF1_GLOPA
MPKFVPILLFLSSALLLIFLSRPASAQGSPPPAKAGGGRTAQRGTTEAAADDGGDDAGGAESADTGGSGEKEEPGLSKKLLNVFVNHLSNYLPKVSTDSMVNWARETFGLDEQSSRKYVKKAQEIRRQKDGTQS